MVHPATPCFHTHLYVQIWLLRENKVSYIYASDQFKGMRQDCTVQHLRNELSASIYEAHARSALQHGDFAEYNQCQSQLLQHYENGVRGCQGEFKAYTIIYQAIQAGRENRAALLMTLQSLSLEVRPYAEDFKASLYQESPQPGFPI